MFSETPRGSERLGAFQSERLREAQECLGEIMDSREVQGSSERLTLGAGKLRELKEATRHQPW